MLMSYRSRHVLTGLMAIAPCIPSHHCPTNLKLASLAASFHSTLFLHLFIITRAPLIPWPGNTWAGSGGETLKSTRDGMQQPWKDRMQCPEPWK